MIQSVNFITGGSYTLTYRMMIKVAIILVVVLAGFYFLQFGRMYYVNNKIGQLEDQLKTLAVAKDRRLAVVKTTATATEADTAIKKVYNIIGSSPDWAEALDDIASSMPSNTWLDSIRIEAPGQENGIRLAEFVGKSYGPEKPTEFVVKLEGSEHFKSVKLKTSVRNQQSPNQYDFSVFADVLSVR